MEPKFGKEWVSKFCIKNHLSSKMTQKRPAKRNRSEYEADVIRFREILEESRSNRKHGKVLHMDEAGLYDEATRERSYVPVGETAQANTPNNHGSDTIICTVC
jgi:hypothetical protein